VLSKFSNFCTVLLGAPGLGLVGVMVPRASAELGPSPYIKKTQTKNTLSSDLLMHPQFSKNLNWGNVLSNVLKLWQSHDVTDKKKITHPTSLDQGHHIPKFRQDWRT
jgi:hypothetical protein